MSCSKGRSFLESQDTYERDPDQISPSAIKTVLHWHSKTAYSVSCAYILTMIKYRNDPVTLTERDPDACIVNNEERKACPLRYATILGASKRV